MTATAEQLKASGRELTAAQTTAALVESFELTELAIDALRSTPVAQRSAASIAEEHAVITARGWIVDELDNRDRLAFERFLDDEATLAEAFGIAR